jgi:hypothetical protein
MRRDAIYYVMPVGDVWLVRAIGAPAQVYAKLEDALAVAEGLSARGARVRVLARASGEPALARTSPDHETDDVRSAAS